MAPYRCPACGNKTRFDVVETKRVRSFVHQTLAGDGRVEQEEVLSRTIEKVVCRWCGAALPSPDDFQRQPPSGDEAGSEP